MEPTDLDGFTKPSDPRMHPDGIRVAFVTTQIDFEGDRYARQLWIWDGEEVTPLTEGPGDGSPRWSPDGQKLAFLRRGEDEKGKGQVAVMAADGGEAAVLTNLARGFEQIEWSPDGKWLAGIGVDWVPEWSELDDDERARKPRRITRVPFRFDNRGWLHDRRRHLYVIDPDDGEARCLTEGDYEEIDFAWHPDSTRLVFTSARHDNRSFEAGVSVFELGMDATKPTEIVERGLWEFPSFSQDGALHLVGDPNPWGHPTTLALWRVEDDGSLTDLTGHLDRNVTAFSPPPEPDRPQWVGDHCVALLEDGGRSQVVSIRSDASVEELIGGDRVISGASPSPDGSSLAFVATEPTSPGELYLWESGSERQITHLNAGFVEEAGLIEAEWFSVPGEGGDIDAWVLMPPGGEQVPLLLNIHGGPATQYGFSFFDEFQVYAAAGYGVVACNPRGSSGRGRDWVRAVREDGWGLVDVEDVTAVVDAALDRYPRLDPDRLGVMGGSYGGFLAAWLIAHQDRYSSAVVERALLGWESFGGTSDIGPTFSRYYLDAAGPAGREVMAAKSPLSFAHRIATPTLILHSESDFRCPIEQAEQLIATLLREGTTAELIRFPGEGHELSRSGKPSHRRERFEFVLDWHQRHLMTGPQSVPT